MINLASRGKQYVVLERRPWAGVQNYGEVIGFRNRADGDRWDVFVPGLPAELPEGEPFRLASVLGVLLVKGGNHKLCVTLAPPHAATDRERISADIREFTRVYAQNHPSQSSARLKYMELASADPDGPLGEPAGQ